LVGAFGRSGLSRRAFCARHAIALSTFDWWCRRLARGAGEPVAAQEEAQALFLELDAPLAATASNIKPASPAWDLELELGAGVVLRLRRGVAC
jgi:putative transposase